MVVIIVVSKVPSRPSQVFVIGVTFTIVTQRSTGLPLLGEF